MYRDLQAVDFPHLVALVANNSKLGPGWVSTYRPIGPTCPTTCPLYGNGCYGEHSFCKLWSSRSAERHDTLARAIGAPRVRHLVTGDCLLATGKPDWAYLRHVRAFHRASPSTVGLMYSHAWREVRAWVKTIPPNLHFLASVDDKAGAHVAQGLGMRTARVTEKHDAERGEVYCPVDRAKHAGGEQRHTCATCRQCFEGCKNVVFLKF